jgi:hypothetical protein
VAHHDAWRILSKGSRPEILLAVDFDVTGRPEARFSDLVANLETDHGVWESVPTPLGSADLAGGSGHLDAWHEGLGPDRPPVKAVMGYCVGGVYAAELAARLTATQDRPPLVLLFDPELSTAPTLYWQFHKVMEFMRSTGAGPEIDAAQDAGRQAQESARDLTELARELVGLFRATGETVLTRAGLDATRRAELTDVFTAFMSYLAGGGRFDPLSRWTSAVAISSASPQSGLNGIRAHLPATRHDLVAREIRLPLEHAELLRAPAVAETVAELLAQTS